MISIVIPLYNKKDSIIESVVSVLNQTHKDFELIVINDGSTDDSILHLSKIQDSRVRVLNKPNGGVSSARNMGIRNSRFDLIAFLDADDQWESDYLDQMLSFRRNYPNAAIFACNIQLKTKKYTKNAIDFLESGYVSDYFKISTNHAIATSSSVLIEKKVFEKVGYFDENISSGEDLDMWFRIINKFQLAFLNKPLAIYNLSESNYNLSRIEFSKDFISKIDNLLIEDRYWGNFKNLQKARSLKPYYIFKYSPNIQRIVNTLDFNFLPFKFYLFYRTPRFLVYFFYKLYLKRVKSIEI